MLRYLAFAADSAVSVFGIRLGEEPPFTLVEQLSPRVEVRRYGRRAVVETTVAAADEDAARGEAFNRLAAYILGANRGRRNVAMTAPVETAPGGAARRGDSIAMTAPVATAPAEPGSWTQRFVLPAKLALATAPEPTDPRVRLAEAPEETVAVIRFSGGWAETALAARRAELEAALAGSRWRAAGGAVTWFYDPPFAIPALRRNEIAIPVEEAG